HPGHRSGCRATREPFVPNALHEMTKTAELPVISGDREVGEMTLQSADQGGVLPRHWHVSMSPAPIRDAPYEACDAIATRFLADDRPTIPRLIPVMREAEEVEAARSAVVLLGFHHLQIRRTRESDETCLFRM